MGDSKEEELSPLQKMKQRSMYLNSRLYGGYYDQQWKTLNQEEYQELRVLIVLALVVFFVLLCLFGGFFLWGCVVLWILVVVVHVEPLRSANSLCVCICVHVCVCVYVCMCAYMNACVCSCVLVHTLAGLCGLRECVCFF